MKAFLVWHDVPFRKSHDLREIGQQCVQVAPTLEALVRNAVPLTVFAWRTRYPDEEIEPLPPNEVLAILTTAERTVAELKRLLTG